MKRLIIFLVFVFCATSFCAQVPNRDSLMTSIRQTNLNNCVAVAIIQASISVFGVNEVFESTITDDSAYVVILKNGNTFSISKEEYSLAESTGHIDYDTSFKYVYDYVILCYAVIIRNRMILENLTDFQASCDFIANGGFTPTSFYYLGLENYAECKKWYAKVDGLTGVVAWKFNHAVYVNNNRYYSGKVKRLNVFFHGRYVLHDTIINPKPCKVYLSRL